MISTEENVSANVICRFDGNQYGNVGIYPGGLITKFKVGDGKEIDVYEEDLKIRGGEIDSNITFEENIPPTNIMSNQHKDIDYEIKRPGYDEPQNKKQI